MVDEKAVMEFLVEELANSTELDSLCVSLFGESPKIIAGLDYSTPLTELTDYPYLLAAPVPRELGEEREGKPYRYVVKIGVIGSDTPQVTGRAKVYTGIYAAEEVGYKAMEILTTAFQSRTNVSVVDLFYSTDPAAYFPKYTGSLEIGFELSETLGSEHIPFLRS